VVFLILGCGKSGRLATYKTTGRVAYEGGAPLKGGSIMFEAIDHPVMARAMIGDDGSFELGTYAVGDGAVAGKHRVAISPAIPLEVDPDAGSIPPTIDSRYLHMDSSGLEYTVTEQGPNHFEIIVQPARR
jgi:hypothetical protein